MLRVPLRFLEGCLIAARAIESTHVFVYIRGRVRARVRDPRRGARAAPQGQAPRRHRRSSSTAVRARTSAARRRRSSSRSRASAASRARSRRSPRSPASMRRRPRSTTSSRSRRCRRSSRWAAPSTRSSGPSRSTGTRVFSLSGQRRPARATTSCRTGSRCEDLIYEVGGGIADGRSLKAVIPGGSSTAILTAAEIGAGHARLRLARAGRDGDRLGGRDRDRRPLLHRPARRPHLAVLRARVVRQVHAVPRRDALD